MKRVALAALLVATAVPAFANDQLARSLGLEPGVYTTAELAVIQGVREGGDGSDAQTAATLAQLFEGGVASTQSVGTPANGQLAAAAGLDGADYTTAELAVIRGVGEGASSSDARTADTFATLFGGGIVSTQSEGSSSAKAQLAAGLGVDPADYTLAELGVLKADSLD